MAIRIKGNIIIPDVVGNSTTSGIISVGINAIGSLTTGTHDVAIGLNSLASNTFGSQNIAIGSNSLVAVTTGNNNIGIGYNAGVAIVDGSNNTVIGNLTVNTSTNDTVLIGAGSTERIKVDSSGLYINGEFFTGGGGLGLSGYSGVSGTSGFSGYSGVSGTSGFSGAVGVSGTSGFSGAAGVSGTSGVSGFSGVSGYSGVSGFSGVSGYSGISGTSGVSGFSGVSGYSGISGFSGKAGPSNVINATNQTSGSYYIVGVSDTGTDQTASASKTAPLYFDASIGKIYGVISTATNLDSGAAGSIPYQTAAGSTSFLPLTSTLYSVLAANTTGPQYIAQVQAKNGIASSTQATGQSLVITSGGVGVTGGSYFANDVGVGGNQVIGNTLQVLSTDSNTGTNTSNALYVAGGAWVSKNLTVEGDTAFKGQVVFQATATFAASTITVFTDNLVEIHTNGSPHTPWTVDDGKDVGHIYHYYNASADRTGFLGLANDTKYLEWYNDGSEVDGVFTGSSYGTFKTGAVRLVSGAAATNTQSGDLQVVGGVGIGGNIHVGGVAYFGPTPSIVNLTNPLGVFTANQNDYVQVQIQNLNTGSNASSDFIATADNGTDGNYYIDVGINNSGYDTSTWTMSGANDGYLYVNSGNLTVGTDTAGKTLKVHIGGTMAENVVATFNANGTDAMSSATGTLVVSGGVGIGGNVNVGGSITFANGVYANSTQVIDSSGNWVGPAINSVVSVSETAPVSPTSGNLWWNSSTSSGVLKIYYTDANTSQWVDAVPMSASGSSGSAGGFEQQFLLMGA